ncbi:MAG: T9SS type A sorting domain-containing protein [Bacteroidota bacterium]|nr:T9SS type A sorting domain-containing protein [Bacteroidota bacterium]
MGFGNSLKAQLSGPKNIPGDYATVELAVADLNLQGVGAGGVTFNVAGGHTETATAIISLTATGTLADPIIFQKSGAGANPIITSYTGGTGTPGSAVQDGIFRFVGSDYVTIDGIDLMENAANIANPATMEYGYAFYKGSATDGCQNNTVKNCTITLNRINNAGGTNPAVDGSRGIEFTNAIPTAATTILTVTASSGANSGNKVYTNTIQNCNYGIVMIGYADATPFLNADQNNDIGGASLATGNTVINYGGAAGATNPAAGIRTLAQYGLNVSYNTINNNNGAGANHVTTLRGIHINTATSASASVTNNTVTVNGGATTSALTAIENASGSTAAANTININNNTVQNCTYTTATSGIFTGILNSSSAATVNINNNTITNNTIPGTGQLDMISCGSPASVNATNNSISGNSKTGNSGQFTAIRMTSPTNAFFSGNTIENNTVTSATATGSMVGIYGLSSGVNITGNSNFIRNLTHAGTGGGIIGIREFGVAGNKNFQSNQIYGFTATNGAPLVGISVSTGTITINGNRIYSLNSTAGTGGTNIGVLCSGGASNSVFNNKIYDISGNNATSSVFGIQMSGGTTNTIYNNLVGDLRTPSASAANPLIGINITGGTTSNIYFNTVYLNGTSSGANFGSSALSTNATPTTITVRNNIFVNNSAPLGTGYTVAYRRSATALTNYGASSNNNLYYAGTPGAANLIFYDGTNSDQTLAAFKTRVGPTRDAASATENVVWQSTLGSDLNYLNVDLVSPTQIESAAQPIGTPSIIDDYDGNIRNATTPDIGAWEGAYTPNDLTAPSISAATFVGNACNLTTRSLTAVISDASNVASGVLAPRCYYKVGAGAYTSVQGTLTSGTGASGTWTFNLTYTAIVGDVISYYIIAQDASANNNITSNPSAGLVATDVNTVTTDPTTPSTWTVAGFLSGTYTVGAAGTYPTLTAAANAYNTSCLSGPVIFSLIDPSYSAGETFPIVFMNNMDAGAVNTLTIMPATGVAVAISGNNASSIIKLSGADYITLDGVNAGGSSLSLTNTNTATTGAVVWIGNASVSDAASNCTVKNASFTGNSSTTTVSGVVISSGVTLGAAAEISNNNMTVQSCTFTKMQNGVFAIGNATTPDQNWLITQNTIGSTSVVADKMGLRGIAVQNAQNFTVSNNIITGAITSTTTTSSGILIGGASSTGSVFNNNISDIKNTNATGYGANGIYLNSNSVTANINVYNNFISDVAGDGWNGSGVADNGYGIIVTAGVGYNVYYNTVLMNTNQTDVTGLPAAFNVVSGVAAGAVNLRNNHFVNTQTTGTERYVIYSGAANTVFSAIDYNNYYTSGPNIGFIGSSRANLAAIQAGFGSNLNSISVLPNFAGGIDLHLPANTNVPSNNLGTPIAGYTLDIDGETRDAATPDMGADEFVPSVCVGSVGGTSLVSDAVRCEGQTITVANAGATTGTGITYQWQVSTVAGGPYVNVTGGAGATTTTYTTGNLTAGTYYYILKVDCSSGPSTGYSTEDTVVVNAAPLVSVTPNSGSICLPGGAAINLLASGASTYTWAPTAGLTPSTGAAVSANPTGSTLYTVTGTDVNGCTATATASLTVTSDPTIVSATATPATLCSGANSQLLVNATNSGYYATPIAYAPTTDPGGATITTGDDAVSAAQTIPFSFDFYGTAYTQLVAYTNGFVQLGTGSGSTTTYGQNIPAAAAPNNIIGGVFSDLNVTGAAVVRSYTTGSAPNRVFTVHYDNVPFYSNTGNTNFYIQLFETSNIIELHVGEVNAGTSTANRTLGIENGTGTSAVTPEGYNFATWTVNPASPEAWRFTPITQTYAWSPVTFLSDPTLANPMANAVTATTSYTVQVSASNGCSATSSAVPLTVDPLSGVTFTATPNDTVCVGTMVTIKAIPTGGGSPYVYGWTPVVATTDTVSVTPSATSTYTVQVDDNCGASTTATVQIVVNNLPVVTATPATGTYCNPGTAVALMASGASTYDWAPTTGLDIPTSATPNASPAINTTYVVTGTDVNGCVATDTVVITAGGNPVITSTTATPAAICSGGNSQLLATSMLPTLVNALSFSSGTGATLDPMAGATQVLNSGNDDTPTAAPAAIGFTFNYNGVDYTQYSVSPDGWILLGGATAANQFTNAVANATNTPKIYPYWDDIATGTDGNVKTLVAGTAPNRIFIVQWFVTVPRATGGPANSTFQAWLYEIDGRIEFRYGTMGSAAMSSSVGLTAGVTNFNCVTITGNTNSTSVANNANADQPVSGTIYTFTPASVTYSWSPTTYLDNALIANPMALSAATSENYTVTATSSIGCSATGSVNLTVNPLPIVNLGVDTSICYVGSITPLTLDASNPTAGFVWSTTETTQTISAATSGTYDVVVTDGNGCVAKDTITVTYNAAPTVNLGNDTTLCSGTVTLDAGNVGNTILWNDASGNQTLVALATGQYNVTVTTPQGCFDQDTIMITINPVPVVNLGNDTLFCGTSMMLDAGNAGASYAWNTIETTQTINITGSGQYFVTVTNIQNCSAKDTINVTIAPAITVSLGNDSAVCLSTSVILDAQNPGSNYVWNDNSTSSSLVVSSPGTYYVTVTSPSGCVAKDTVVFADNSPIVTLSLPFSITCVNTTVNTLSGGTPVGGNYSGAGVFGTNFDASIPGAGPAIISYTYIDIVTGCDATANQMVTVDPCIGINEVTSTTNISVAPNPTSGYFSILTAARENVVKADLYSADGKLLFSDVLKGSEKYDVNISEYANGIYYLQLSIDGEMKVIKVAKQY